MASFFDTYFTAHSDGFLWLSTLFYFSFLYFGVGWMFWKVCRFLNRRGYMERINPMPYTRAQLRFELRQSIYAIVIFAFSTLPLAWLIQRGVISTAPNTFWHISSGLALLTLWNEVHFYAIHRLLHTPYLMKHIHAVHHRSVVPSVFSVYSFHPVEAALLSSVLLVIAPFYPFAPAALMLFPLVSILINFIGHSNYRLLLHTRREYLLFATRHNEHHGKAGKSYGFMTRFMDRFFSKNTTPKP